MHMPVKTNTRSKLKELQEITVLRKHQLREKASVGLMNRNYTWVSYLFLTISNFHYYFFPIEKELDIKP